MKKWLLITACSLFFSFSQEKIKVLYTSLKTDSVTEHLAFYQLFPETGEGKKALQDAWKLLSATSPKNIPLQSLSKNSIDSIVTIITKAEGVQTASLNDSEVQAVEELASHLPNRRLKGYSAKSEEDVLKLPTEEVDLAHALFLAQSTDSLQSMAQIRSYEALIDLMALQILTQIKLTDPPKDKIRAINRYIFEEMRFRFPPHSSFEKDIDLYTYLPAVLDTRRGVCLGVSILYLSLSQRLDLPLQAMTPPGHIYVRYCTPTEVRNIETTARGIHLDTEEYLGLETETVPERSIKDVIGLAYFNEASVHWQHENYEKALSCYLRAAQYLPDDLLLKELMGFNYLFLGEMEKGRTLLQEVYDLDSHEIPFHQKTMLEDYLKGYVDAEGIRLLFSHVDDNREALLQQKEQIETVLEKWPAFRSGYFHLAILWVELNRHKEALLALQTYEKMNPDDPTAQYFLAELYAMRFDYPKAWEHFHRVEHLLKDKDPFPEPLKELKKALARISPE